MFQCPPHFFFYFYFFIFILFIRFLFSLLLVKEKRPWVLFTWSMRTLKSVRRVFWAWWSLKSSIESYSCHVDWSSPKYLGRAKRPQFDFDMCRIGANAETDYLFRRDKTQNEEWGVVRFVGVWGGGSNIFFFCVDLLMATVEISPWQGLFLRLVFTL